jgi:tetratricopeptide (TPR) repeat protein
MARDSRTSELILTDEQTMDGRLSPAEAHRIIRQRLERLAARWDLRPDDLPKLARQMRTHTYALGEIILPSGVRADCFGLVVRGQVAVHVAQDRSVRPVVVLLPGSSFGEAMLTEGQANQATLQALSRCEIRFLRRADVEALRNERRAEREASTLWRLVTVGIVLLAVMLVAVLVFILPSTRQAIVLVPMGIGQWCSQRGYDRCAAQAWQAGVNLAPTDPNALLGLGTYWFEHGEVAAAEQAFEAAKAVAPDLPEVYNNLGLIYAQQGEHERAIAAYRKALSLEPGVAITEYNLGVSLQVSQAYDEALEHYQAALALGEPQTSTLVNMAIAYYEAGESDKAVVAARQALLYDDQVAAAYTVLGAVALEARQPEQALPDLHRAIALDAGYGQAYFYLGLAYKSLGQQTEAITAFERALANADDEVSRVRIRRHLNELYGAERQSETP